MKVQLLLIFLLWWGVLDTIAGGDDGFLFADKARLGAIVSAVLLASFPADFGFGDGKSVIGSLVKEVGNKKNPHCKRKRKSVSDIFKEQGAYYTRRAYRMDKESFWELHKLIHPYLRSKRSRKRKVGAKNGLISTAVRLICALRYFAGGSPHDIALVHGVSHSAVFVSVWKVVDAVNQCPELGFEFPSDHDAQFKLAEGFARRSKAGFKNCAGAIDGMLLWIEKPTAADCEEAECGPAKFFCGRKSKFGLNFQAICDAEGRFLDVFIGNPTSTSDFLSFTTSPIYFKLDVPNFLAKGLSIFGDSAYVNCRYMVTPFKAVKSGPKDAFNYYQSQLRIKIECCFGMFVHRCPGNFETSNIICNWSH